MSEDDPHYFGPMLEACRKMPDRDLPEFARMNAGSFKEALEEIELLGKKVIIAEFRAGIAENNYDVLKERLMKVDPEFAESERKLAQEIEYWDSPEGQAELDGIKHQIHWKIRSEQ